MLLISACLHKVLDRAYPSLIALPTGGVGDCQPQIALCQRLAARWGWIVFTNTDAVIFVTIFPSPGPSADRPGEGWIYVFGPFITV